MKEQLGYAERCLVGLLGRRLLDKLPAAQPDASDHEVSAGA